MSYKKEIVVYLDICGTLFFSNTTFDFFDYYLKGKFWNIYTFFYKSIIWKSFNKIILHFFNIDITRRVAILFLRGKSQDELLKAAQSFYDDFLKKKYNNKALEIIYQLKSKGYLLYYISATLDLVAKTISKNTGIPVLLSTELVYKNGICQGRYKKEVLNNKLDLLKSRNELAQSFIILTDNLSDFPLVSFSETSYIFTNRERRLKWQNLIERENCDMNKIILYEH